MDVTHEMMEKAIKDFDIFIKRMLLGYTDDYQNILNEILFIDTSCYLDHPLSIYETLSLL